MNTQPSVTLPRSAAVLAAIALLATGVGAGYLLVKPTTVSDQQDAGRPLATDDKSGTATPSSAQEPSAAAPLPDVEIQLAPEAVKRAGIVVAPASSAPATSDRRFPGVVAPDAYRQVAVTPLVAGRVTSVPAELGQRVRRGQTLAHIYSPQLAEAQTRYVSAAAMLEAHDRELQRTRKLVEIGAASRQELERIHAEHAAQTAAVQSARAELELLGVAASRLDTTGNQKLGATSAVPAPINGEITERSANVGLNVTTETKLFTVLDLSTVWILADIHERDLAGVRIGSEAAITVDAFADTVRRGRISYVDPHVNAETRTAQARIELSNQSGELRPGMYVDVVVSRAAHSSATLIPRGAVQQVADRTVVYLADANAPGKFVEREVTLGQVSGDQVEVVSGVRVGDRVVSAGSFFVRAERERLGLRARPNEALNASTDKTAAVEAPGPSTKQRATVTVTDQGYEPATVTLRAGTPTRLTFVRTSDKTCGTEVAIPSLNVKRALPLNQPVDIDFTPSKSGEITFVCGMNMLKGTLVVE